MSLFISSGVIALGQDDVQIKTHVKNSIEDLREFIAIPNDALDKADINRNITWLTQGVQQKGIQLLRIAYR